MSFKPQQQIAMVIHNHHSIRPGIGQHHLLPVDDDRAEGNETLTATIIPSEHYSTGGATGSATALLSDNDWADVSFQVQIDESIDTDDQWTEANQIRTSESRTATGRAPWSAWP